MSVFYHPLWDKKEVQPQSLCCFYQSWFIFFKPYRCQTSYIINRKRDLFAGTVNSINNLLSRGEFSTSNTAEIHFICLSSCGNNRGSTCERSNQTGKLICSAFMAAQRADSVTSCIINSHHSRVRILG